MKKLLVIFMIILCSCGIGYLGYLIFRSKNIDTVELVGRIQTVYMVGDEIDFEDAKLKVTYKNGNIKMIDLTSKSVDVEYFSTSVETHGKMDITYKSETIEVEYDVIRKGAYFLSSYEEKKYDTPNNAVTAQGSFTTEDTKEMIYLDSAGVVKYYERKLGPDNKNLVWFMNDGFYDKNYTYTITGSEINIKLKDKTYSATVKYSDSGKMYLSYEELFTIADTKIVYKQKTKTFEYNVELKTDQSVQAVGQNVVYNLLSGNNFVDFIVGETYEKRNPDIYVKATYAQYATEGAGSQYRNVYVRVAHSMITTSLDLTKPHPDNTTASATVEYMGRQATMKYTVRRAS